MLVGTVNSSSRHSSNYEQFFSVVFVEYKIEEEANEVKWVEEDHVRNSNDCPLSWKLLLAATALE